MYEISCEDKQMFQNIEGKVKKTEKYRSMIMKVVFFVYIRKQNIKTDNIL